MKALEKDRARRYETANGLARDIDRFLKDEAVEACPPTLGYRVRKLYRKNRAAAGVAAAFVLLLTLAATTATVLAVRARSAELLAARRLHLAEANRREAEQQRAIAEAARRKAESERQRAEQEKQSAQAVRDFLQTDLLQQAAPLHQAELRRLQGGDYAVQHDPTIRELLDRAAARLAPDRIEARFPGMPVVQADVLTTVGETYVSLLEDARGKEMLERAVAKYRSALGDAHPTTIEARQWLAMALFWTGREAEGLPLMEAVCADRIRVQGANHPDTFASREYLGAMYISARRKDVIPYLRRLRDDALRQFGPDGFHTLYASHDLGEALLQAGRAAEALPILEAMKATDVVSQIALDHPYAIRGHGTLARAYIDTGQPEKAVEILRPFYEQLTGRPDASPGSVFEVSVNLYRALRRAGRQREALGVMERALALAAKIGRAHSPSTWPMRHELAWIEMGDGRPEAALARFRQNLAASNTPERKATTLEAIHQCLDRLERHDEALVEIRGALAVLLEEHGQDHRSWRTGVIRTRTGQTLVKLSRHAEAEPLLIAGYDDLVNHLGDMADWDKGVADRARTSILGVFQATKAPEKVRPWAEALVSRLEASLRTLREAPATPPRIHAECVRVLGLAYVDAGRVDDAAQLYSETLRQLGSRGWDGAPDLVPALRSLRAAVFNAGREDLSVSMLQATIDTLSQRPDAPRDLLAHEYFSMGFQHLNRARRHAEAVAPLRQAVETLASVDPDHWNVTKYRLFLGEALLRGKHYAEAEPVLLTAFDEAVQRIARAPAWERHFPGTIAGFLAELYTATGRPDEAARWQAEQARQPGRPAPPAPR